MTRAIRFPSRPILGCRGLAIFLTMELLVIGVRGLAQPRSDGHSAGPSHTDYYGDPLPAGALARMGSVQLRQHDAAIVFSGDGKTLISACADAVVHFWDRATGREVQRRPLRTSPRPQDHFGGIALAPGGRLVAAWWGEVVYLCDTQSGTERARLLVGRSGQNQLAFSPDGKLLATGISLGGQNRIRIWDVAAGNERLALKQPGFVDSLVFSGDGRRLATCNNDGLHVWNTITGAELCQARSERDAIALSPDGKVLASAASNGTITLWDAATLQKQAILKPARMSWNPTRLCYSPDGTVLVLAGRNDLVVWDVVGRKERRLPERNIRELAFTPDGKTLACAGAFEIHLLNPATGQRLHERPGHDSIVGSVAVSPDGKTVASSGWNDPRVLLWDAATGRPLPTQLRHRDFVRSCAFSADGQLLVSGSGRGDGSVCLWESATGREVRRFPIKDLDGSARRHEVLVCQLSRDGQRLAAVSWAWDKNQRERRQLSLWDARTGAVLARRLFRGDLNSCFTPDVKGVTVAEPTRLVIEETATGREREMVPGDLCYPVAFSPDGNLLAVGIHETEQIRGLIGGWRTLGVRVAEVATGQEVFHLDGPSDFLAISPDGCMLVTADPSGVRTWHVLTGQRLGERTWPTGLAHANLRTPIGSLAFLPGGRAVVTGMGDGTLLVWELTPVPVPAFSHHLESKELDAFWSDLAAEADKAGRAMRALPEAPASAVPFLKDHLRPAVEVDHRRVQQLLTDLDREQFAVREAAAGALAELGEPIEPALERVLAGKPSLEMRRRVEHVLAALHRAPPPTVLRTLRCIQVLEQIGTPEARQLLRMLTTGAPAARETREAREALERMGPAPGR